MIVSKSQGQTFDKIGLYIDQNNSIFEHGQFYVALLKCRSKHGIKIQIISAENDIEKVSFKNFEFEEMLQFYSFFISKDLIVDL